MCLLKDICACISACLHMPLYVYPCVYLQRLRNYYLPITRVSGLCEMQKGSFRIWSWVVVSIFYDGNHYTTNTSTCMHIRFSVYMCKCMYMCVFVYTHVFLFIRAYLCWPAYVCVCLCIYTYVCVSVYVSMHVFTYFSARHKVNF